MSCRDGEDGGSNRRTRKVKSNIARKHCILIPDRGDESDYVIGPTSYHAIGSGHALCFYNQS